MGSEECGLEASPRTTPVEPGVRSEVNVLRSEMVPRVATERVCGLPLLPSRAVLVVRGMAAVREAVLARLGVAAVRGAVVEGWAEERARLELLGARDTVGTPLEVVREGVELERYELRGSEDDGALDDALGVRVAAGELDELRDGVLEGARDELER